MDLTLKREEFTSQGIFGTLYDKDGNEIAVTLEHAYPSEGDVKWAPKVPAGSYTCLRSEHRLHKMLHDFETFQVMDVSGHDGILIHPGNYNVSSQGCILVGLKVAQVRGQKMITNSQVTFANFMKLQQGVNNFNLTIT